MVKAESQVVWDPEIDIIKRLPNLLFSEPCINRKFLGEGGGGVTLYV